MTHDIICRHIRMRTFLITRNSPISSGCSWLKIHDFHFSSALSSRQNSFQKFHRNSSGVPRNLTFYQQNSVAPMVGLGCAWLNLVQASELSVQSQSQKWSSAVFHARLQAQSSLTTFRRRKLQQFPVPWLIRKCDALRQSTCQFKADKDRLRTFPPAV